MSNRRDPSAENRPLAPPQKEGYAPPDTISLEDRSWLTRDGFTIMPSQIPGTHPPPILFQGQIEPFDRVGTHQEPLTSDQCTEACDERIEGWLVADGADPKLSLHLAIAGMVTAVSGNQEKLQLNLNGVLIRRTP